MNVPSSALELLKTVAHEYPERPFLVDVRGSQSVHALAARVAQVAAAMAQVGLQPGESIALMLPNCREWVEVFFAAQWLGALLVPIPPTYRYDEVARILAACQARLLVGAGSVRPMLARLFEDCTMLRRAVVVMPIEDAPEMSARAPAAPRDLLDEYAALMASVPEDAEPRQASLCGEDLLSLTYTAGSTGAPRGVFLTHANYLTTTRDACAALKFGESDRILCDLPLFQVSAQVLGLLAALMSGAALVMPSAALQPALVRDIGATILLATPNALRMFCAPAVAEGDSPAKSGATSRLRMALSAGGPVTRQLRHDFHTLFGVPIVSTYGLTEACGVSAIWAGDTDTTHPAAAPLDVHQTVIGHPLASQQIRVAHPPAGEPAPGQVGELLLRGPNLMRGYAGDDAASQLAICDGWLHTEDLGFIDAQGVVHLVGRKKELIIRDGEHVYPEEIDEVLERHPAVARAAVMGVGPGEPTIIAFVQIAVDHRVTAAELREYCAQNLAEYKCPDLFEFRDVLPATATGQIRKGLLAKNYRATHPRA